MVRGSFSITSINFAGSHSLLSSSRPYPLLYLVATNSLRYLFYTRSLISSCNARQFFVLWLWSLWNLQYLFLSLCSSGNQSFSRHLNKLLSFIYIRNQSCNVLRRIYYCNLTPGPHCIFKDVSSVLPSFGPGATLFASILHFFLPSDLSWLWANINSLALAYFELGSVTPEN